MDDLPGSAGAAQPGGSSRLLALVGLGVAIDYSLLIVTRWREERANGRDNRAAVLTASATAGRSVLFSGVTVTVSLAALAWAEEQTGYDSTDRITSITATGNSGTATLCNTAYCYSSYVSGQPCPTASAATNTELLRWAKTSRLASSPSTRTTTGTGSRSGTSYSYGLDNDGNLLSGTSAGTLSYNTSNQITADGATQDHDGGMSYDPANGTLGYTDASQMTSASAVEALTVGAGEGRADRGRPGPAPADSRPHP